MTNWKRLSSMAICLRVALWHQFRMMFIIPANIPIAYINKQSNMWHMLQMICDMLYGGKHREGCGNENRILFFIPWKNTPKPFINRQHGDGRKPHTFRAWAGYANVAKHEGWLFRVSSFTIKPTSHQSGSPIHPSRLIGQTSNACVRLATMPSITAADIATRLTNWGEFRR